MYIIQQDDNNRPMLVDYDTGCGCCAEYRAVNVTEDDTFYDTKWMDEGKVTEAVRETIDTLRQQVREMQEYALRHGLDIGRHAESEGLTPKEERDMGDWNNTRPEETG